MTSRSGDPVSSRRSPVASGGPIADTADVRLACERISAAGPGLVARPWAEIAGVLGRVGARFRSDNDPLRTEALERLPEDAGLSVAMAREVLDGMSRDWTVDRLSRTVEADFEEPACLDGMSTVRGRHVMAMGPALCLQIVSGSVPGVGVNALLRSLLVKSPTLVKPGRGDIVLTELFARGLREADPQMAEALAVRYWPGGVEAQQRAALAAADVAVVYGSDETVADVRATAPATTRVVAYHHRIGVALIGREVLAPSQIDAVATDTARAVALFEQRGCVCPHVVYVESGGQLAGADFADCLASAFGALEEALPSVTLDAAEGAALQQLRGTAELHAATGAGFIRHGGGTAPWTVIYEEQADHAGPVTLARGVRVQEVDDASALAARLSPLGAHLQSVAYAGLEGRVPEVAESLGRAGASRVVPIDRVSFPPPWWLHDGRGPLRDLVRWVEVER